MADGCGHVIIPLATVRVIGSLSDEVYCEKCNAWRHFHREATALERAAKVPQTEILPFDENDEPPY